MAQEAEPSVGAIRRVAVLGAGGLGAAYASRCHEAGLETWLIAAGERAARLRRDGLVVNGRAFHIPVRTPDAPGAPADLILIGLKHHHLAEALPLLGPFLGPQTVIISLLNGLDSEEIIGAQVGPQRVLYALVLGIDAVREGNVIQYAAQGRIIFGELENTAVSPRVRRVQAAFDAAGIPYETPPDMRRALWRKFMINVGVNQASAVLRAPYALFQTDARAQGLMEALMREVVALAQAQGIDLGEQDVRDWYGFLNTLAPGGKTSMLQDVEAGRRTEGAIFGGKVVALGRELGIATPVNETVWGILQLTTDS